MKTAKKLLAVLLALCLLGAMATVLTGCGDEKGSKSGKKSGSDKGGSNSPESVVEAYLKAKGDRDAEKMVELKYAKPMLEYMEDEYDKDKDDLIDKVEKENFKGLDNYYGDDWKITNIEINDVYDVDDDEYENLQYNYEDTYDMKITDAKEVSVDYIIKSGDNHISCQTSHYTVFEYKGKWYIDN